MDLWETVQFETDSAVLLDRSKTLLDDVARELNDHPEIRKVQIEGHTDSTASNRHTVKLSREGVASVRRLCACRAARKGAGSQGRADQGVGRNQADREQQDRGRPGQEPAGRLPDH